METNSLFLWFFGVLWGWLFIMLFVLAGGIADFISSAFSKQFDRVRPISLRLVSFVAALCFLLSAGWLISQQFLDAWFPGKGKEFGGAFLLGFMAFFVIPRIENSLRRKRGKVAASSNKKE